MLDRDPEMDRERLRLSVEGAAVAVDDGTTEVARVRVGEAEIDGVVVGGVASSYSQRNGKTMSSPTVDKPEKRLLPVPAEVAIATASLLILQRTQQSSRKHR